jgi:hypothetical protein
MISVILKRDSRQRFSTGFHVDSIRIPPGLPVKPSNIWIAVTDRFKGGSGNSNYLVESGKVLEGVRSKAIGVGYEPD